MARETITKLVDDLDGGEAAETIHFGLDGQQYEIDLSAKNAKQLRSALSLYVEKGTRIAKAARGQRRQARDAATVAARREESRAIREWAVKKGLEVAARGRINQDVIDAYRNRRGR